jgi:hypothetical protein
MYAVSSEIGCTVINGDMAVDVPAGGQSVILALDKKLIIEGDDNAKFVEVRWGTNAAVGSRSIPWMSDVVDGLVSIVGVDKLDINYLPVENKLVVHTDRVSDELSEEVTELLASVVPQDVEVVQYNHNIEVSWQDVPPIPLDRVNIYDACVTLADFEAIYANLSSKSYPCPGIDEWWKSRYPEVSDTYAKWGKGRLYGYFLSNASMSNFQLPGATDQNLWLYAPKLKNTLYIQTWTRWIYLYAPNITKLYLGFATMFDGYIPNVTYFTLGTPQQLTRGFYAELPSLSSGVFISSNPNPTMVQFNKDSALRILNSIPAWSDGKSHTLSIGIHIDHQNDEEVLEAIANAESKGWTMTVQWNGKPTAQASTFNMGQLIYAKVGEMENPDGTTEQYLEWGHYVTNPEEYETFRSLESAYEYFNLPMPEVETEEELQIEEIENA